MTRYPWFITYWRCDKGIVLPGNFYNDRGFVNPLRTPKDIQDMEALIAGRTQAYATSATTGEKFPAITLAGWRLFELGAGPRSLQCGCGKELLREGSAPGEQVGVQKMTLRVVCGEVAVNCPQCHAAVPISRMTAA